jgi:hypothetical protein
MVLSFQGFGASGAMPLDENEERKQSGLGAHSTLTGIWAVYTAYEHI